MKKNVTTKNILFVENGIGYGGAAICMRHLARNLDRSRFEPFVVTGRTGPRYQEIAQEATWAYIPDHRIDVAGMKGRLENTKWLVHVPGMRFILNQLVSRLDDIGNFLPFLTQLLWFAWRNKIALVHANNEPLCNRAALLVAKFLRIPAICHVRGEQSGSAMMSWAYRLPDHFIPVSHWISAGIGRLGIAESKRTVIYDGIPLDSLNLDADGRKFRKTFGIPDRAFAIGLVGLLIPWKGQDLFLDAAKLIRSEIPDLRMLIIGGTPEDYAEYEKALRNRVSDERLEEIVTFTGHVSDMPVVYNGLDIVVSASTSPEPLGTVVIECMAMGRPLVAPNHGGAAEMADNEVSALLFQPGEAQSLAEAFIRLHQHPEYAKRLGTAAREKALATFAVQRHVSEVQDIYEAVL